MPATIRIDNEVWEWLKSHATPLEDTPNSVLRRLAGLGTGEESVQPSSPRREGNSAQPGANVAGNGRVTGRLLNQRHGLGAKHCLYHKDGTFYEILTAFPGVLCDDRGFVRYESEASFANDSRLKIGEKVNVPKGLPFHPRYKLFPSADKGKNTA